MANKPASRNWNDIQLVIATGSMALTLAFWNQFAAPDRESAMKRAQERAALPPPPVQTLAPVVEEYNGLVKEKLKLQDKVETIRPILQDRLLWSQWLPLRPALAAGLPP